MMRSKNSDEQNANDRWYQNKQMMDLMDFACFPKSVVRFSAVAESNDVKPLAVELTR